MGRQTRRCAGARGRRLGLLLAVSGRRGSWWAELSGDDDDDDDSAAWVVQQKVGFGARGRFRSTVVALDAWRGEGRGQGDGGGDMEEEQRGIVRFVW